MTPRSSVPALSGLIGDLWHGQGIGAKLLGRVLQIAKNRKIERVWGTVLRENRKMITFGKTLGFTPTADTDLGEIKLKIDLTEANFSFLDQNPAGG
jgi:acetyltransferase